MKFKKIAGLSILFAVLTLFVSTSVSQSHTLCEGFLPENDLKIPVGDNTFRGMRNNGGITEAEFNSLLDRIQNQYTGFIQQKGKTLVVNRLWSDSTVNASAQQQGNRWIINMYGGMARHPDVTFEGMAVIACHEMGHHIGGAPKVSNFMSSWATNEGGSDYFATLKCMRDLFANDDNASIISKVTIDPFARSRCLSQFTSQREQDLCMRISMGGESVSYVFQSLKKEEVRPKFDTPDTSQVSKTNDGHPATQCRLDTYFAGTICPVSASIPVSDSDFKAGSCVEGTDAAGFRSRCWFNPASTGGGGGGGGTGDCPFGNPSICEMACQLDPSQPFCKK